MVLIIGAALVFLYVVSPDTVVWIGKAFGSAIVWLVTKVAGTAWSLITGFAAGMGG